MEEHTREVILMGEEMPTCPTCGERLEVDYGIPVDMDGDGAIWRATCPTHGNFLVQDDADADRDKKGEDDAERSASANHPTETFPRNGCVG